MVAAVSATWALDATGKHGTCNWTFDSTTGVLVISSADDAPSWGGELKIENPLFSPLAGKDEIKEVIIEEGVSEIGTGAFMGDRNLKKITFASTVVAIGFSANSEADDVMVQMPFFGCIGLETLIFKSRYAPDTDNRIYDRTTEELYGLDPSKVNLYLNDGAIRSFVESGWGVFNIYSLPPVAEGTFGEGFSWKLSEGGKLTVMGRGAMPDLETVYDEPWAEHVEEIKELVVAEGITHIGDRSFGFCANMESAYLPATLESIGEYAFGLTNKLTEITCAAIKVPTMGKDALPVIDENTSRYIMVWWHMKDEFLAQNDWNKHKIIGLSAQTEFLAFTDGVDVEPRSENAVYLTWPQVAGATAYVITLTSEDGWFTYEITISSEGKVSYVKKSLSPAPQYALDEIIHGFGLEINGLEPGKNYTVTVVAKDETKALATFRKQIVTVSTDIESVTEEISAPRKILRNGRVLILHNNRTYNLLGAEE